VGDRYLCSATSHICYAYSAALYACLLPSDRGALQEERRDRKKQKKIAERESKVLR